MNKKEIQANRTEQPLADEGFTNNLADLPVTTEQETQVVGGRSWTLHKGVDNPDV